LVVDILKHSADIVAAGIAAGQPMSSYEADVVKPLEVFLLRLSFCSGFLAGRSCWSKPRQALVLSSARRAVAQKYLLGVEPAELATPDCGCHLLRIENKGKSASGDISRTVIAPG
jgi:hypothetical protein